MGACRGGQRFPCVWSTHVLALVGCQCPEAMCTLNSAGMDHQFPV